MKSFFCGGMDCKRVECYCPRACCGGPQRCPLWGRPADFVSTEMACDHSKSVAPFARPSGTTLAKYVRKYRGLRKAPQPDILCGSPQAGV